ncbi:MAG: LysE family translocator [Desulfovibrio sp.]|uniref:LysE family translocator n=1 Tax=Desulfovibrio sp. TaxID=885 RepID=UPI002A37248F|nr:LysE family translocator [Desulfovibrio sp.]MDY0260334.1 LysE family translocator [Desulfovibrio sp.]
MADSAPVMARYSAHQGEQSALHQYILLFTAKVVVMISLENLLLFIPMAAILVMLPGPDFALIAKISLLNGRPQGQAAACGVALGICVHTTAAMLGISAIIAQSILWFSVLKYVGAAYLIWLGVQALRHSGAVSAAVVKTAPRDGGDARADVRPGAPATARAIAPADARPGAPADVHVIAPGTAENPVAAPRLSSRQWWSFFCQGFLTNALNPKAVIIFLTFLPQFTDPHAPLAPQFLELGGIMSALCLFWFVPLAYMLGRVRHIFENSRFQLWLQRFTGFIFIAFGLKLAAAQSR